MQKSGPGTEAQSESISRGDRNLIQVILLFIPHLTDLKDFSTSLTLVQTSLGNACTRGGHQEILGWSFCSLGMDSKNREESSVMSTQEV